MFIYPFLFDSYQQPDEGRKEKTEGWIPWFGTVDDVRLSPLAKEYIKELPNDFLFYFSSNSVSFR